MQKFFISIAFIFAATSVTAQPSAKQLELASNLVNILQIRNMFDASVKQCTKPADSYFDPKVAYSANPSSFGGITPKSAYWAEVETLYRKYQQQVCSYITVKEFEQFYAFQFATETSEEDLKAAISFYSSKAGKRYLASTIKANEKFQRFAGEQMSAVYRKAYGPVSEELQDLVLRYQKEPK